jgi:hypothetical protein
MPEEPSITDAQREELKTLCQKLDVPDRPSAELDRGAFDDLLQVGLAFRLPATANRATSK